MNINCPHCNSTISLEASTDDTCARELFALIASMGMAGAPLVAYLGLFKPRLQPLRWSRALALANDVRVIIGDSHLLTASGALIETVEALRERRLQADWSPLKNHNYFKQVFSSAQSRAVVTETARPANSASHSKAATALQQLEGLKR